MIRDVVIAVVGIVAVALVWALWISFGTVSGSPFSPPGGIACTADAMLCPDGSYVGRTGPRCEFVCPTP